MYRIAIFCNLAYQNQGVTMEITLTNRVRTAQAVAQAEDYEELLKAQTECGAPLEALEHMFYSHIHNPKF